MQTFDLRNDFFDVRFHSPNEFSAHQAQGVILFLKNDLYGWQASDSEDLSFVDDYHRNVILPFLRFFIGFVCRTEKYFTELSLFTILIVFDIDEKILLSFFFFFSSFLLFCLQMLTKFEKTSSFLYSTSIQETDFLFSFSSLLEINGIISLFNNKSSNKCLNLIFFSINLNKYRWSRNKKNR